MLPQIRIVLVAIITSYSGVSGKLSVKNKIQSTLVRKKMKETIVTSVVLNLLMVILPLLRSENTQSCKNCQTKEDEQR